MTQAVSRISVITLSVFLLGQKKLRHERSPSLVMTAKPIRRQEVQIDLAVSDQQKCEVYVRHSLQLLVGGGPRVVVSSGFGSRSRRFQ